MDMFHKLRMTEQAEIDSRARDQHNYEFYGKSQRREENNANWKLKTHRR